MRPALDVYVENADNFNRAKYYILHKVICGLRSQGIRVRVLDRLDPKPTANAAFLHFDLTNIPPPFIWTTRLYSRCVNGGALSISRESYSTARVTSADLYSGPVIAKSVLNFRGLPEFRYAFENRRPNRLQFLNLFRRRSDASELVSKFCPAYQIFPNANEVPESIWSDPGFIVERFIPENQHPPIIKYRHDFMFDIELNTRSEFGELLCAPDSLIRCHFIDEVPQEIYEIRRQMRIDYGAIDYFVVNGQVTVIDVNKTTTFTEEWAKQFHEIHEFFDALTARLSRFIICHREQGEER